MGKRTKEALKKKKDPQMAKRYMERCSASLIKEMQIKITARYYLLSKRQEITSASKNVKKRELLCSISRNVN